MREANSGRNAEGRTIAQEAAGREAMESEAMGQEAAGSERRYSREQLEAIRHREGPCMVIAGPGAGKTTVITERVRAMIREDGIPPSEILVITFTRAAAAEMEERFIRLAGRTGVTFGTFHSVFYQILRKEGGQAGTELMRDAERVEIIREYLRRHAPSLSGDPDFAAGLLAEISNVRNNRSDPRESAYGGGQVDVGEALDFYEAELEKTGKLDFDDMLERTCRIFRERPGILKRWREHYRYIMVDEFQDVNRSQYEAVRLLAAPENNLFIVGDDDQSIYRFRGGRPEIMLGFQSDYPDARIVRLETNYRSERAIVEAAASLIGHNEARFPKKLRAAKTGRGEVTFSRHADENAEGDAVIREIREEIASGTPPEEIAVLIRARRGASGLLGALAAAGIPFTTREKVPNLFRHFSCGPIFGYLNYAEGCRTRENFLRFMNCPNRYIRRSDLRTGEVEPDELAEQLSEDAERNWMGEKVRFFGHQLSLMERLKSPYAMINYVRKGMGMDGWLLEQAKSRHLDTEELMRTVDEIQDSARSFGTVREWYGFVAAFTRQSDESARESPEEEKGKVVVSTLHGSKGLEYEVVIIPDVNERVIPHEKAKMKAELEEERRLLYVGMTRAVRKLSLHAAEQRNGRRTELSRFLGEIRGIG